MFLGSKRCQHASHIWLQHSPRSASSSALRFSQGKGERLVMNRKGPWEGSDGRRSAVSPIVSFLPSFARTFSSRERRLGSRQVPGHFYKWRNDGHLTAKIEHTTRAVSTCFVPRKRLKYLFGEANIAGLEFSFTRDRLKISRWSLHSCTIFEAYLINYFDFLKFNFHISLPKLGYLFSVEKRKPKIFGLKNAMEREILEIRKCLSLVILEIASKIFGKIILKPF